MTCAALAAVQQYRDGMLRSDHNRPVQHNPAAMFSMSCFLAGGVLLYRQGVRSQIEDVRAGMLENVDKVLERGEKIEVRHECCCPPSQGRRSCFPRVEPETI